MTVVRRIGRLAWFAGRTIAAGFVFARLARAAGAAPPVRPTVTPLRSISIVVPARDEAGRIGPLLACTVGAPGVAEVIVVDDGSSDATAELATHLGARVVPGTELPPGWAGKAWALQQGLLAAGTEWVVTLDADTRPDPSLATALVARAEAGGVELLTVAGRFECPTAPSRWLHAAMLTTLVYRFGPPGSRPRTADRTLANGQCMVVRREPFLARGGLTAVAGHLVEDVALARAMAHDGAVVEFLDAADLLTVRMFESFHEAWRGWGRSLALPGVEPPWRQLVDLAVIVVAQVLPLPRLLARRGDVLDVVLACARLGTLVGTRRSYDRVDTAYWLSPLADPLAALVIVRGIVSPRQAWRGRYYGASA
ncbi:MAG: glycosyltransferase [Ilumatobacteraceae bacterium]